MYTACPYKREAVNMINYETINNTEKVQPEQDALDFYLAIQIMGIIELKYGVSDELPEDVAKLATKHHNIMEQVFFRMFTYILLISIGESRHGYISGKEGSITSKFDEGVYKFAQAIKGNGRSDSRELFLSHDRELLTYSEYCEWNFDNCFSGGSFGGAKWQNIASKTTQVLNGEISPYTMVDISWALVHNTGSIFNKNTIYYKDNTDTLGLILDIQRGGGIGSHILNKNFAAFVDDYYTAPMIAETKIADKILDGALSVRVEPIQIKDAGALHYKFIQIQESEFSTSKKDSDSVGWVTSDTLNVGSTSFPTEKRSK